MPRRAWRRRRWPTPTSRSRTASRSSRSSTRSICPGAQPDEAQAADRGHHRARRRAARSSRAPRKGPASTRSSRRSSQRLPPPTGDPDAPLKALIFDSWYDAYRGVIILTRVIDGVIRPGMKIRLMAKGQEYEVDQVGVFSPKPVAVDELGVGEVGFIFAGIKTVSDAQIGDTITEAARRTRGAVSGLQGQQADGLRRAVPGRRQRVPAAARRAREAAAERRVVFLRAGNVGRARVRLPLRVPRAAPHGDRPGAARARVRHGPRHDGAGRAVPRDDDRRRGAGDRQPVQAARHGPHREDRGAGHHGDDAHARPSTSARSCSSARRSAACRSRSSTWRRTACW